MKKIIKNADGSETVFEGTPEELAALEKSLGESRGTPVSKNGKRILNEQRVSELIAEALEDFKAPVPYEIHYHPAVITTPFNHVTYTDTQGPEFFKLSDNITCINNVQPKAN